MNVSAIVSAYYASNFIRARLDNLMVQNVEIIVVAQSGSEEAEVAKSYGDRIIWILTPDVPTIYKAWNIAIKASNCDYITNANCDDKIYSGSYAEMAKVLNDDPSICLVYGDENQFDGVVNKLKQRPQGGFDLLKNQCFVGPMPMWRKSLHDKYGYFHETFKVCGDYEFWLRLAVNKVKFHHISRAMGLYLNRQGSAEHRNQKIANEEKEYLQTVYRGVALI